MGIRYDGGNITCHHYKVDRRGAMANFKVSRRHWAADWWWICVDEHDNVLFTSPRSCDTQFEVIVQVNDIIEALGKPMKMEVIVVTDEPDTDDILI